MNADVELVYFSGCPNVNDARGKLGDALRELGRDAVWQEWNLDDSDVPERVRGFASPAVLVAGRHVMGDEPVESGANSCSASGAPPTDAIVAALRDGDPGATDRE